MQLKHSNNRNDLLDKTPNFSICMATHNGESFVLKQLKSIADQISAKDEIIIVDDASYDNTLSEIQKLNDHRVKLIKLDKNVGHVRAFEKALEKTNNEIIYFADQDDIWTFNKHLKVSDKFAKETDACLVVHSLSLINEEDAMLNENWLQFSDLNINGYRLMLSEFFHAKVFGSSAAFKRDLLNLMLPFPKFVYAHDHWLTICASFCGQTSFMEDRLVLRRIHEKNITPINGLGIFLKIKYRLIFIYLIIVARYRMLKRYKNERK